MANKARTSIYVTRHGLSEHNLNTEFFMGRSPASRLTEVGRTQARRLGERLSREAAISRVVCSSLPRTMETAELIAAEIGCAAPLPEEAFWELDKGSWEGAMPRDLPPEVAREVAAAPLTYCYGGSESYSDVVGRAAPAFEGWVAKSQGKTLLFVLHGDVIRALLFHLIQFPPDKISDFVIDPCSLSEFNLAHGRYRVLRLNDTSHLS